MVPEFTAVALPLAVVATMLDTLNEALPSASVSPSKRSEDPSVTVKVLPTATDPVSLSATGASFTPITVTVNTAISVPPFPSDTV